MGRIPQATISEIRSRIDIVDLVGRYVQLKKAGRNHKGLCPFHDEKTPSFNVSSERQIFKCFGCDAGGGVVDFLMRHENLSFPEAVRTLARECGVEVPEEAGDPAARGISERVFEANEIAQRLYVDALAAAEGEAARAYLERRGLDADTLCEMGVGFAPDRWDSVTRALRDHKIEGELGNKAGLLSERASGGYYDLLRGRVTFPIYDVRRRIVAFGGRVLGADQEPKYLNTPESPVFRKRESFYGFPWALESIRKRERAIVCEGYFDRIALHRAGLGEALATCGTALTREHGRQLRRRTKTVVLLFDGDAAGEKAIERALEVLLPEGLRVRAAALPSGQDPDDFLVAEGADALCALVDGAVDALELVIRRAAGRGCTTPSDKADAVGHAAPLIALVSDPIEREAYVRRLSLATASSENAVATIVRRARGGQDRAARDASETDLGASHPRKHGPEDRKLLQLCQVLLRHPTLATDENRERLERAVPDSDLKSVALALMEANGHGWIDADGMIDHARVGEGLEAAVRSLLERVAVHEDPADPDAPPEKLLDDFLSGFERASSGRRHSQTTEKLRAADPSEAAELIRLKQLELEEKRARRGLAPSAPLQGAPR